MKKIVIALDYNPSATAVAEKGMELAKAMGADTVLLHVLADPGYYAAYSYSPIMGFENNFLGPASVAPDALAALRDGAETFLLRSKEHLGGDGISTQVAEGETADTIVQTAADLNADLVVLGSHSRRGLDKILMGSVTGKVLQLSSIPLFIVPTKG